MASKKQQAIKKIGIVANPTKTTAFPLIGQIIAWLEERGVEVLLDSAVSDEIGTGAISSPVSGMPGRVDLMVAFGGDGTMLSVAQHMNEAQTPLMGVKVGGLGFLTGVTEDEVFETLEEVLAGRHRIEERMTLGCTVIRADGSSTPETVALNDVVIQRDSLKRMFMIETYVDEEFLASYACDGLIISTPTGSTAHSLSAGGPIVHPDAKAIVVTPICPHMLTNRPLVLSSKQELKAVIRSDEASAGIMIDGQISIGIDPGDEVLVHKSPLTIHLAASSGKSYFEVLRTKLNWGRR
jgi:NAD+ kinase